MSAGWLPAGRARPPTYFMFMGLGYTRNDSMIERTCGHPAEKDPSSCHP